MTTTANETTRPLYRAITTPAGLRRRIDALNEASAAIADDSTLSADERAEALAGIGRIASAVRAALDIPGFPVDSLDVDGAIAVTIRPLA